MNVEIHAAIMGGLFLAGLLKKVKGNIVTMKYYAVRQGGKIVGVGKWESPDAAIKLGFKGEKVGAIAIILGEDSVEAQRTLGQIWRNEPGTQPVGPMLD